MDQKLRQIDVDADVVFLTSLSASDCRARLRDVTDLTVLSLAFGAVRDREETTKLRHIAQRIRQLQKEANRVFCQNCQEIVEYWGFRCASCEQEICLLCGCTDYCACAGGCSWSKPGFCSECADY